MYFFQKWASIGGLDTWLKCWPAVHLKEVPMKKELTVNSIRDNTDYKTYSHV